MGRGIVLFIFPIVFATAASCLIVLERHHKSISEKMSVSFATRLLYAISVSEGGATNQQEFSERLARNAGMIGVQTIEKINNLSDDKIRFWDYSARSARNALMAAMPGIKSFELTDVPSRIEISLETKFGLYTFSTPRSTVTPSNAHQLVFIILLSGMTLSAGIYIMIKRDLKSTRELSHLAKSINLNDAFKFRPGGPREVIMAKTALEQMCERIKSQEREINLFVNGISHDLRTPLTRIRISLSLLDREAQEQKIALLESEARTLSSIIDKSLEKAKESARGAQ